MNENWLPAYGHHDYEVSDHGSVWSVPRVDSRGCKWGGYYIRSYAYSKRTKHRKVRLNDKFPMLHRLVLSTFDRPPLPGEVCRHLDGDASNNFIGNLKWGTPKENAEDRIRHGNSGLKSECVNGHAYDLANTGRTAQGWKRCRTCDRENKRARYRAEREASQESCNG